jgi:hypothetical protein
MTTCGCDHDENGEVQDCTPATPCRSCLMAEVERLRKDREECLGSIDAFLGEASRWIERDGSMFDGDLCEIADRRLRYTLDALRSTTGGA